MRKLYKLILIFFLCALILGCNIINKQATQEHKNDPISALLDSEYRKVSMNTGLELQFYEIGPIVNDFRIGSDLNFVIRNNLTNSVYFFSQEGIHIYMLVDGQYVKVEDKIGSNLDEPIIILPSLELPSVVAPDIQSEVPVDIVIVVTGTSMNGDKLTNEIVGAYIECTLEP